MVSIGGRTLIYAAHFLVPNDKQALLEATYEGHSLRMGLIFRAGNPGDGPSMSGVVTDRQLNFEFINWNNPGGTVSMGDSLFAKLPSGDITYHLINRYVVDQNHVHVYLYAT